MLYLMSNLKVLKIVDSVDAALYHADLLAPNADYYINDVSLSGLATYADAELRAIHDQHNSEITADAKWSREVLLGAVLRIMKSMPVDSTPVFELRAKLGREPQTPQITPLSDAQRASQLGDPNAAPTEQRSTQRSTAPGTAKRPKPETASGRIWAQADALLQTGGFAAVRDKLIEWGEAQGINASTVRTQYGHWRRFNNL